MDEFEKDNIGRYYVYNGKKVYVDGLGRDLRPMRNPVSDHDMSVLKAKGRPTGNKKKSKPLWIGAGEEIMSGAEARAAAAEDERRSRYAAERQKTKKLTKGAAVAAAAVLAAWGGNQLHGWAIHDPTLANMQSTAAGGPQIIALREVIDGTNECRLGGVTQTRPGYFYGESKTEVKEETCWVALNEDFLNLLNLSLGEENVKRLINEYKETNKVHAGYDGSEITNEQAKELLELLSLRVEEAQTYLQEELQRKEDEQKDRTALIHWKEQPIPLPPITMQQINKMRAKVLAAKLASDAGLLHGAKAEDASEYTTKGGGTRRKRHKRRKTKKHHKSKQKKTTRRVRRKHKKRQTRRKS